MSDWGFLVIAVIAAASMLLVFNWRRPVSLSRTTVVAKPVATVWPAIDHAGGDLSWQQHLIGHATSSDDSVITLDYAIKRDDGSQVDWSMQFNIVERVKLSRELKHAHNDLAYYQEEIVQIKQELDELMVNDETAEKFAREHYLMKRDNEDVFVILPAEKK